MRKMKIDDFAKFTYPSNIQAIKDKLIFKETKVDLEGNKYISNIAIYDRKRDEKYLLTNSGKDFSFKEFDDGFIYFISTEGKKKDENNTIFYKINPHGGERELAFKIDLNVSDFYEINQDKVLLLASKIKEKSDFEEIRQLPFWFNGQGYIQDQVSSLYIFDRKDKKLEKIIDDNINIDSIEYKKGDKKAIVIYQENTEVLNLNNKLGLLDLEEKKIEELVDNMSIGYANYFKDGIIFIASTMEKYGLNEFPKVYFLDKDKNLREISHEDFDISFFNSLGTDLRQGEGNQILVKDDYLYYISTDDDKAILSRMDIEGNVENIIDKKGSLEAFTIDPDTDEIYFTAMRDLNLVEIYKLNEDGSELKLSNYSKDIEDIELSQIEEFEFNSDGNTLKAYVLKPVGYEKGKKYPAILEIHGGPRTSYSTVIHHEMQYFASLGYFVFYTNPRGSSGRGVEYSDIRGKYGTIDYDDLMTLTDRVIEKYQDIDKDRLAVMGGSYGGFMTNWIIGHTDRFKVANSQRSISNWTSFYGVSDIGFYFAQDQTRANPWDNLDKMWEQSPLKYVKNVKTPTLFIHSDEDYRCPLEQGIQMYAGIKLNNVDSKIVIFHGENHELSRSGRPKGRIKRLEEIKKFYEKYLG